MIYVYPQEVYGSMHNKSEVIKHCSNWYKSLSGKSALSSIEQSCSRTLSEIFGYYAIQIGVLSGECNLLKHSRIAASFSLAHPDNFIGLNNNPKNIASDHGINNSIQDDDFSAYRNKPEHWAAISDDQQLPISTDEVDLVIASHVFETSNDPHQVLREIDRILVPEGHCILIGFNPYALNNFKNRSFRFSRKRVKDNYKMRSVSRVRDWFLLLGFEVLDVDYMGFRPALKNQKLFDSLSYLEKWGKYAGPLLGGMYIIHAKKQEVAMRPNKKVWRAPALIKSGKVALNRTAQKVRRQNLSGL